MLLNFVEQVDDFVERLRDLVDRFQVGLHGFAALVHFALVSKDPFVEIHIAFVGDCVVQVALVFALLPALVERLKLTRDRFSGKKFDFEGRISESESVTGIGR